MVMMEDSDIRSKFIFMNSMDEPCPGNCVLCKFLGWNKNEEQDEHGYYVCTAIKESPKIIPTYIPNSLDSKDTPDWCPLISGTKIEW